VREQAGPALVTLRPAAFRDLITRTLATGGDGYCLHSALAARPDTRELLAALRRIGRNCGPPFRQGLISHISIFNS
jgi:hypothetical protein